MHKENAKEQTKRKDSDTQEITERKWQRFE